MFLTSLKIINWFFQKRPKKHLTEEPPASIVDEPTSEKIIMAATTEDIVSHVREWSLERVADKSISKENARAILAEFYEWIEPDSDELEIVSLEPET